MISSLAGIAIERSSSRPIKDSSQVGRNRSSGPWQALPRHGRLLQGVVRQVGCGVWDECRRLGRIALVQRGPNHPWSRCGGLSRPRRMAAFMFDAELAAG